MDEFNVIFPDTKRSVRISQLQLRRV